jgi:hypothetical protein
MEATMREREKRPLTLYINSRSNLEFEEYAELCTGKQEKELYDGKWESGDGRGLGETMNWGFVSYRAKKKIGAMY